MATKDEIFNYVMQTPENTNPAVLKSLLETISDSSGSNIDTGTHHTLKLVSINANLMTPVTPATQRLYIETEQGGDVLDTPYVLVTPSVYQILHFVSEELVDTTTQEPTDETIVALTFGENTTITTLSDVARAYNTEVLYDLSACSDPSSIPENLGTVYYLTQPINDCFLFMESESDMLFLIPSSTGDITTDPQFERRYVNLIS